MKLLRVLEGGLVTFALLGEHMDDDGPIACLGKLQGADQQRQVVAVNRSQIPQAHLLEDQAAAITATAIHLHAAGAGLKPHIRQGAFKPFLRFVRQFQGQFAFWQPPHEALKILGQLVIRGMGDQPVQVGGDSADVLGYAPFVVVEDADELLRRLCNVVHRLKRDAVGQRRIAEDCHHILIAAALVARRADSQCGG